MTTRIGGISVATLLFLVVLRIPISHSWGVASPNSTLLRIKRQDCGFACANGDCISTDNVCDGTTECADGSDETAEECSKLICPQYLFRCAYGACINRDKICNGIKDCADNSDETVSGCSTGSSSCSPSEYRCANSQCIDSFSVCDGKADCADGSDETKEKCGGTVCPPYLFRCAYGPCVDKKARCNRVQDCADGSDEIGCGGEEPFIPTPTPPSVTPTVPTDGGCLLPNHPPNGVISLPGKPGYTPNAIVAQSTAIKLRCNDGYKASEPTRFDGLSHCISGQWFGDRMTGNVCARRCLPLDDPSFESKCSQGSVEIDCKEAIEGTTAITRCVSFFTFGTDRARMTCQDGRWLPNLGSCVPDCGVKMVNVQTLIIKGETALEGEYPWIVAVYHNGMHICGGSIISRRYVLSAAHCFTKPDSGKPHPRQEYRLVAGKYHRLLNDTRDSSTQQIREIENLIVHDNYRGRAQNHQNDIALLVVKEFVMTLYVRPVCVDWEQKYEELSLLGGNLGVVAGWGYTEEGGNAAEQLKKLVVPIQNKATCEAELPTEFYQLYYTPDKLCAGYINNATNICNGDSGGGYYFQSNGRFFVRGIVSLAPTSNVGCNKNLFALYTKVSLYNSWLEQNTGKYL